MGLRHIVKREFTTRSFVALFIVAFLCGVLVKSLVKDSLTIGFDDYTLARSPTLELNQIQKELIQKGGTLATGENNTLFKGESCSEAKE